MNIVEALKDTDLIVRSPMRGRWMYWEPNTDAFIVRQRDELMVIGSRVICTTADESEAVAALLGEGSDEAE